MGHMNMMSITFMNKGIKNMGGIMVFLAKEVIGLYYLIPIILLALTILLLFQRRRYISIFVTVFYLIGVLLLIFFKLASYSSEYPLSTDYNFYMQGAFYLLIMIIAAIFLFEVQNQRPKLIFDRVVKTIISLCMVLYTSGITASGIAKFEYNQYLKVLIGQLSDNYQNSFFIISKNDIPYRFSRVNMHIESETLNKSNLWLGQSIVLLISSRETPYIENGDSVYINALHQFMTTDTLDQKLNDSIYYYRTFKPIENFGCLNQKFYKGIKNFDCIVVDKKFMNSFNKKYGFKISEFCNQ